MLTAVPARPVNPNTAASSATTRNTTAQENMVLSYKKESVRVGCCASTVSYGEGDSGCHQYRNSRTNDCRRYGIKGLAGTGATGAGNDYMVLQHWFPMLPGGEVKTLAERPMTLRTARAD